MDKSKLQMLCQRSGWELPVYSTIKHGPEHKPSFTATVTVDGLLFHASDHSRNAKEAQNKAAILALRHFCGSPSLPPHPAAPASSPALSDVATSLNNTKLLDEGPSGVKDDMELKDAVTSSDNTKLLDEAPSGVKNDMELIDVITSLVNTKLLDEGPSGVKDDMELKVTSLDNTKLLNESPSGVKDDMELIDMQHWYKNWLQNYTQMRSLEPPVYSFEREGPPHASRFKSTVTIDGKTYKSPEFFSTIKEAKHSAAQVACESLSLNVVQVDTGVFKNLLQKLAQKEGFDMPKYETAASGMQHLPTFVSTVQVGGKSYIGAAATHKKQAEINAAKVAYIDICKETRHCALVERQNRDKERAECSELPAIKESGPSVQAPKDLELASALLQSVLSSFGEHSVPKVNSATPPEQEQEHPGAEYEMPELSNAPRPTRILVFPRGMNLPFPEGAIEMPYSDQKWVALKLMQGSN